MSLCSLKQTKNLTHPYTRSANPIAQSDTFRVLDIVNPMYESPQDSRNISDSLQPRTMSPPAESSVPEPAHRTSSRGALIGGTVGGVALLAALILCFVFKLYLRRKRHFITTTPLRQYQITEGRDDTFRRLRLGDMRSRVHGAGNGPFRRQVVHNPTIDPLVYSDDYVPPENKRGMFWRVSCTN